MLAGERVVRESFQKTGELRLLRAEVNPIRRGVGPLQTGIMVYLNLQRPGQVEECDM